MFNQAAYSCTHFFFCGVIFTLSSHSLLKFQAQLICLIKLLIPAPNYHHIIKPQSLQVRSSANMLNYTAYSFTHNFLWSHLHIVNPQYLQVGRATHMFNHAAFSFIHYFLWSNLYIINPQKTSSGWVRSSYV